MESTRSGMEVKGCVYKRHSDRVGGCPKELGEVEEKIMDSEGIQNRM